jgi:cyclophilin family peptidyl-prolyl cis-trans isomerase
VGTERRARQKANRAQKLEQEKQEAQRAQRRHYLFVAVAAAIALAGVIYLISLTGGDDGDSEVATDDTESSDGTESSDDTESDSDDDASSTTSPTAEPAVLAPEPGASVEGTPECPAADGSAERTTSFTEAPPMCIDPAASYTADIETTLGTITVALDAEAAPETVNNFVFLSRYHYYEGVPFHRIIPGFVIQGGDATGDPLGTGNPGYEIDEEPPSDGYPIGSIAMANAGAGTTGSQFFIVTGEQGEALPADYSWFGEVTEGMEVVSAIESLPTTVDDFPLEEIYIDSVTITES